LQLFVLIQFDFLTLIFIQNTFRSARVQMHFAKIPLIDGIYIHGLKSKPATMTWNEESIDSFSWDNQVLKLDRVLRANDVFLCRWTF
jgi:hypothetical protein